MFALKLHNEFWKMLEKRLDDMSSVDAKFFGLKQKTIMQWVNQEYGPC